MPLEDHIQGVSHAELGAISSMSDTLITSVSGIRGIVGKELTPELVARYAAAMGVLARREAVVVARDARTSGPMLAAAARAGLQSVGCRVIDCGLVPTPTAQLAVEHHGAGGGIIVTASHNPVEWNALKFVGPDGIFLDEQANGRLSEAAGRWEAGAIPRAAWDEIGEVEADSGAVQRHLDRILGLSMADVDRVREKQFVVVLDCVRGAGGTIMPDLLEQLGCQVIGIDLETDGRFPRSPEPVPQHLERLCQAVRERGADLGVAVDPDVDRLALVDETGRAIGEDYTLAFAVRAVLERELGPVVVNQSTSLVVDDAAAAFGVAVERAPVGEANVARAMRDRGAIIGGEGNGGVMLPELHLGRDAPLAALLVLGLLSRTGATVSELVTAQPQYSIVKVKVPRTGELVETYASLEGRFPDVAADRQDGLRLAWSGRWLHVRPSGTEPVVRMIAEAASARQAEELITLTQEILAAGR
jgi:phosphomannomutase